MDVPILPAVPAPELRIPDAREILEHLPLALALLDADGHVAWRNAKYLELVAGMPEEQSNRLHAEPAATGPHRVTLRAPGREDKVVLAHSLHGSRYKLLALDDTPGQVDAVTLEALHARLAELERDAMVDRLTGAWNRRYLDHAMEVEHGRARRYRQPLAAMLLDIDHFKRVNDTFGHAAGDAVLCKLAETVRAGLRASDSLVRWGGEEFLVLMPYTTHQKAAMLGERLRADIAAQDMPGVGRVTASFGVGELLADETPAEFFTRIDAALYRAKEGGRNWVECDPRGASDRWSADEGAGLVRLVWRDEYCSGNAAIDAEHEQLFQLGNDLLAASVGGGATRAEYLAALDRCIAHIATHFAHEESILAARGYSRLAQHREVHRMLLERAAALRQSAVAGETTTGILVEFLAQEMVMRHLLCADRDFFPLFATPAPL